LGTEIKVTDRQHKILKIVIDRDSIGVEELASRLNLKSEDIMRDLAELEAKGLITRERIVEDIYVLTDEGRKVLIHGLPEEIVYNVLFRCIDKEINKFIECISKEAGIIDEWARIGFQHLIRSKCIKVSNKIVKRGILNNCHKAMEEAGLLKAWLKEIEKKRSVPDDILRVLRRRKFIEKIRSTKIMIRSTAMLKEAWEKGLIVKTTLLTIVTPQHYMSGILEKAIIKKFDLSIPPPRRSIMRLNAYMEFLDLVREILVSMGFEEVKGPHVELELWNFDVLFQAQDHPAREIHDTFFLDTDFKGKVIDRDLIDRIKTVHESGWGYKWSLDKALNPILRTQTTAVSARIIYERGPGEYRCFTLDRVFRPETLDAKHAMEFYQLDGIIVGKDITFRDLLAFFREFAAALGIKEIWFKPGYFPFTEPSVEGFIKHPSLGWIEVFPGGMFRPEVMKILGAEGVRAIAWGIGIDRLAMTVLGINDIRDLFSKDLGFIEKLPDPRLPYFTSRTSARDTIVVKYPL